MTDTVSGILTLLLIALCVACAAYRVAAILFAKDNRPRGLSKGPSYVLAILGLWAALFLAIPLTLVWGLVLAALLGICHLVTLWKMRARRELHAGPAGA